MKAALASLIVLLTLVGCAQLPLSTAWSMRNVDYLTVDPRVARMALALPTGARLQEVVLELTFTLDGKLEISHRIPFDILVDGAELERVGFTAKGTSNVVLQIPAGRVEDVARFQQALLRAREGALNGSAGMGISSKLDPVWVEKYCARSNRDFKVQAWVLVNDLDGYLPIIHQSELMTLLDTQSRGFCQSN